METPPKRRQHGPQAEELRAQGGLDAQLGLEEPSFWDLLRTLAQRRWTVTGLTLVGILGALLYLAVAPRVYRSTALVQVSERVPPAGLSDLQGLTEESPSESEAELLRSRTLLGSVVDQLGLDVEARPVRLPILGEAVARAYEGEGPAAPRLGITQYCWGGEQIAVASLETSERLLDRPLTLTVLGEGRYRLAAADGALAVEGAVGSPAAGSAGASRVAVQVSSLVARPGTRFELIKRPREDVIDELLERVHVEERGKSVERARNSGVLAVAVDGEPPARVAAITDAIVEGHVRLSVERKTAESERMSRFLDQQLPRLKANLEKAELALSNFQKSRGTIGLSRGTEAIMTELSALDRELSDLELQGSELRVRFTDEHPALVALGKKMAQLRAQRPALEQRMRDLPAREMDLVRLTREAKVASDLYVLLMNRAQEVQVARAGLSGSAVVIDHAKLPRKPLKPKPLLVLLVGLAAGLALGVAAAFALSSFEAGVEDPDEIEVRTGLLVFATVPHSDEEARAPRRFPRRAIPVLAEVAAQDAAVENLRSLRAALESTLSAEGVVPQPAGGAAAGADPRGNVVTVGGLAPAAGKSFVTINLCYLLAANGWRVLVVDCDLRRGILHRFGAAAQRRERGLTEVMGGGLPLAEAARELAPGLALLSTGRLPPNPTEVLASRAFRGVLAAASARYDLVVLDTPPVLAVADALYLASKGAVNLLVLRAGQHPIREIRYALKRFARSGIQIDGAVLNDARLSLGRYGRYLRSYRYESERGSARRPAGSGP